MPVRLIWDSAIASAVIRDRSGWYGALSFNPPRDIALPDRPLRKSWRYHVYRWYRRLLGPCCRRCGGQSYYAEYSPPDAPLAISAGSCVRCRALRAGRVRRAAARPRTTHRLTLWQLATQRLAARPRVRVEFSPQPRPQADQREHQCAVQSGCRSAKVRKQVEAEQDVVSFFRCWWCGGFFPRWFSPLREKPQPRYCYAHEDIERQSALPLAAAAIRQLQALWLEASIQIEQPVSA